MFIFLLPFLPTDAHPRSRPYHHEINFSTARDQVMAPVTLQHPIVFDQYNICAMAEDTLKNLKVSLLQVICQGLNLDIPINQFAVKLHT